MFAGIVIMGVVIGGSIALAITAYCCVQMVSGVFESVHFLLCIYIHISVYFVLDMFLI